MKWYFLVALALLCIAPAAAETISTYFDATCPTCTFLREEYSGGVSNAALKSGVCQYHMDITQDSVPYPFVGYWPSTGSCDITAAPGLWFAHYVDWFWGDHPHAYLKRNSVIIPYDNTKRGAFTEITDRDSQGTFRFNTKLTALPKTIYNNYSTLNEVPIMVISWCGERFTAKYTGSTVAPTEIYLTASYENDACSGLYSRTGGTQQARYGFYSTVQGEGRPFELPLNRICEGGYKLVVNDRSQDDWPAPGTHTFQPTTTNSQGQATAYKAELGVSAHNSNWFFMYLTLNQNRQLSEIRIDSGDRSPSGGGGKYTLYCVNPKDPDQGPLSYCEQAGGDWWPNNAGTPPANNGCCGDDVNDQGRVFGEYTCDNIGPTAYAWKHASGYCSYPSWWQFGADADDDPTKTYRQGAGCCSDPTMFSKNHTNATNDAICALTANNEAFWMDSAELSTLTLSPAHPQALISNGTRWLFCNGTTGSVTRVEYEDAISRVPTAGSCTMQPDTCTGNEDYTDCMITCDYDGSGGEDCPSFCSNLAGCSFGGQMTNCNAYSGTYCMQGMCTCPSTHTWNGTSSSCEPYSPRCPSTGYTYNSTIQKCQKVTSLSMGTMYTSLNTCGMASSPAQICLHNWTAYNPNRQYIFNSSGHIMNFSNFTERAMTTDICRQGNKVPAIRKERYEPSSADFGFCLDNECYLGNAVCVQNLNWTYRYICLNTTSPTVANWTTRTQLLADTMYRKINATNPPQFTLHCDTHRTALNNHSAVDPYAIGANYLVNEVCVYSDGVSAKLIGVSLNSNDQGRKRYFPEDVIDIGPIGGVKFISLINDSASIRLGVDECTAARTPASKQTDGQYHECDAAEGKVWYNPTYGIVLMTPDGDMTLETSWFDSVRRWWNSFFTQPLGNPFITLSGQKVFITKKTVDDKVLMIQAETNVVLDGNLTTIVYQNVNVSRLCQRYNTPGSRVTCGNEINITETDWLRRVTIKNATNQEWQDFTLAIRP